MTPSNFLSPAKQNQYQVNEIFLRTVAENIFIYSQEDYDNLMGIAIQLPYLGGDAVYTSRVMLGIDPDDYGVSYRVSKDSKKTEKLEGIKVYPNPANESFYIELINPASENTVIEFFNVTSQLLQKIKATEGERVISISQLNYKGLVFIKVIDAGCNVTFGKIVIK